MEPRSPLAQPPGHRISRILGHAFRLRPLPENASHPEARFRDTVSAQNGTHFPDGGPGGKRVPESRLRAGQAFRLSPSAETASRNKHSNWDALSK